MSAVVFVCVRRVLFFLSALGCILVAPWLQAQVLSAGYDHNCTIDDGGGVQCWGANGTGQLGDNSLVDRSFPVRAKHLNSDVVAVAVASAGRSCALRSNGEVLCWGGNEMGVLGDGTTVDRRVPTSVIGLGSGSGVVKIALGSNHACALRADGAVLCWGGNQYGQVGSGTSGGVLPPTVVSGFGPGAGVIAIAAGNEHTCAVKSDQAVYCWGRNTNGALGDGTASNRDVPTLVTSLGAGSGVAGVSAGSGYTCAVRYDGATFCWGYNGFGQLGDGTTTASLVPKLILGPATGAVEVNGLYGHTCARTATRVLCWGSNNTGELGDGTTVDRHFSVPVLTLGAGIDAIATGVGHSCARKSGGKVVCWGRNFAGQLGNGTFVDALTPQVVELNDSIFGDGFE